MEFYQVIKNVLSVQYALAKDEHYFFPVVKSYVYYGNVVFFINTQSDSPMRPQILKIITCWCAIKDINFWFITL